MLRNREHSCTLHLYSDRPIRPNLWLRFQYMIRQWTTISPVHPLTNKYFRSIKLVEEEQFRHMNSKYWFTIHPYSMFCYYWQIIMVFVFISVVTLDLINLILMEEEFLVSDFIHQICWVITNCLYIIHMVLKFFTGYVKQYSSFELAYNKWLQTIEQYETVFETKQIANRYLKRFFIIDFLTFGSMFNFFFEDIVKEEITYYIFGIALLRVIRFYTAAQTTKLVVNRFTNEIRIYYILVCSFMSAYCILCFAFLRIMVPYEKMEWSKRIKFSYTLTLDEIYRSIGLELNYWKVLVHAMYDTSNILHSNSILYFQNSRPTLYLCLGIHIIGLIIKGWFFGLILKFLYSRYRSCLRYYDFLSDVDHYTKYKHMDNDSHKIMNLHVRNMLKSERFTEKTILETLDERRKFQLFVLSSMDLIRNCHLFRNLPTSLISDIALRLKREIYVSGNKVLRIGDTATCMYFVASGTIVVYNDEGEEVQHLYDGEYFGELCLITKHAKRMADIYTIEDSVLYRLDESDFTRVIIPTSKIYSRMRRYAFDRLAQLARISKQRLLKTAYVR